MFPAKSKIGSESAFFTRKPQCVTKKSMLVKGTPPDETA